ncbi:uncharacterized protein PgNI_02051 [Pyricularia grisea]|uniref:Uncharacterized protein n=1 Tax=Pyricularia grisea TaxID=148305 RepID=A0A6P8BJE7_PYRGI|nr:uncharacterized protein PgNI_02051 [Pyricularia grisea]TLD16908.1 hypothetical protein PgNI_02051 [Pyricularia grisea]
MVRDPKASLSLGMKGEGWGYPQRIEEEKFLTVVEVSILDLIPACSDASKPSRTVAVNVPQGWPEDQIFPEGPPNNQPAMPDEALWRNQWSASSLYANLLWVSPKPHNI